MTNTATAHEELQSFGQHYDYDVSYLKDLLATSPGAFAAFSPAMSMGRFRRTLPLDAHFVAKFATMQGEDCGPCSQLTLKMAVEAGVDRELLATLVNEPDKLPDSLLDVRNHARDVAHGTSPDVDRVARIKAQYGEEAFAELAVTITGSRIYPTLKRALLRDQACSTLTLEF